MLGDFQLAEDAAQEAFIEAYRNLSKLQEAEAFSSWFRQIVVRQCHRIIRRKTLPTEPIEAALEMPSEGNEPPAAAEENELKEKVLAAIKALPENERMVTTLFYINGYSQKEIAAFMEVSVTTVNNCLRTSRKRLKERLVDNMVRDTLQEQRPSRDDQFVKATLFKAIEQPDQNKVKELLDADATLIHTTDEKGRTPITVLTKRNIGDWQSHRMMQRQEMYQMLTSRGAEPEFAESIIADDRPRVQAFVEKDASLVHRRFDVPPPGRDLRLLPLGLAAIYDRIEIMEYLIEAGADVNADNDRALAYAAFWGRPESIEWLIGHGAKVNPYYKESSPLIMVCQNLQKDKMPALLAHGADPNACVKSIAGPPLAVAMSAEARIWDWRREVIEALIEADAGYEDNALMAVYRGRADLLEKHLDADPDLVHQRFQIEFVVDGPHAPLNGGTLLHFAADYDEPEIAKLLIERGVDVNAQIERDQTGVDGTTPIYNAASSWYNVRMVDFFIEHGADLTVKATVDFSQLYPQWKGEILEVTPLGFMLQRSPSGSVSVEEAAEILRQHGAPE